MLHQLIAVDDDGRWIFEIEISFEQTSALHDWSLLFLLISKYQVFKLSNKEHAIKKYK